MHTSTGEGGQYPLHYQIWGGTYGYGVPRETSQFKRNIYQELNGRHRVQSSSTQVGLEAGPSYFSEDSSTIGAPISRSIYESPISLAATVCQLETRPPSHGNRFLLHELDHSPRQDLRQPTMGPDRQSPVNSPELKGLGDGSSGSCLESPSMIPSAFANVGH